MALFRQPCRGGGTLAAGYFVLLTLLFSASAAGAGTAKEQAAERYRYAHLLLEDLHTVPVAELGEEQYLLVIDAFQKVTRTSPDSPRSDDALLQIGNLYRDMIGRFGAKVYKAKSIATYELLVAQYPQSKLVASARKAVADIQKGVPAPKRSLDPPADDEDQAPATAEAAKEPASAETPAAAAPVESKAESVTLAVLPAPDPNAVATLSSRSLVIPVADKPKPGEQKKTLGKVENVHFWSNPEYTRVVIELDSRIELSYDTLDNPKRLFFDLLETRVGDTVLGAPTLEVNDAFVNKIRVAQFSRRSSRVVLDLSRSLYFDVAWLSNPLRLVVELRGTDQPATLARAAEPVPLPAAQEVAGELEPAKQAADTAVNFARLLDRTVEKTTALDEAAPVSDAGPGKDTVKSIESTSALNEAMKTEVEAETAKIPAKTSAKDVGTAEAKTEKSKDAAKSDKPAQATAKTTAAKKSAGKEKSASEEKAPKADADESDEIEIAKAEPPPILDLPSPKPATANARGQRNLIRALGLKVGRVVIDAGHGGHDTGSIGGAGLREKDLVLDIALRLGKLIEEGLGSEVIYTRNDDRFISLKERTTLANERKADLFISIHANSSRSRTVRGVETYYLNFTTDSWALTVASRENAASDRPVHELQDLLSKIALKEKIEESREFATRVQNSLYDGLGEDSKSVRDRGVRKAPFMVLIGAKMPAVLAEIGFLSNAQTEKLLKTGSYRQKVANHLYQGILNYSDSLGSISMARSEAASKID